MTHNDSGVPHLQPDANNSTICCGCQSFYVLLLCQVLDHIGSEGVQAAGVAQYLLPHACYRQLLVYDNKVPARPTVLQMSSGGLRDQDICQYPPQQVIRKLNFVQLANFER